MKKLNPKKLKRPFPSVKLRRTKTVEERVSDAISTVPKITNETVTEHREDVLSSARKYIYPLQHSKHHIVRISLAIFITVIIGFIAICGLDLYKLQGTSGFMYAITKIFPVPVAKAGGKWVSYESYLFELRRNMHYYQNLQQVNFSSPSGKTQLNNLKKQALNTAVEQTVVEELAKEDRVNISDANVDYQMNLVKSENRIGGSDQVFKQVLSQYWGWNEADFKRELKQQLLIQAVVSKLDTPTHTRANSASNLLEHGTDFGMLASQISDDTLTKSSGGQYPNAITINDQQVPPIITQQLFKLNPNQISGVVNAGYTLEILKVVDKSGTQLHAAHIQFNFVNISKFINPVLKQHTYHVYVTIK